MIPQWRDVIDAATALLAPGGALHIVDFGHQERLPARFAACCDAGWRCFTSPLATISKRL